MKKIDGPTVRKILGIIVILVISIFSYKVFRNQIIYDSINAEIKKGAFVEYKSDDYNIKNLVTNLNGKIISNEKSLDTSVLGAQEVVLKVKKKNVIKKIPVVISVVDKTAPVINIKKDVVRVTQGSEYDLNENVDSVTDEIDGNLNLNAQDNKVESRMYEFSYNDDISSVGSHEITIKAIDSYGNVSTANYTLEVVEETPYQKAMKIHYDVPANVASNQIASLAYQYIGYPYVGGANGPYAFDCSGFVQYIYSQVGIGVSRSTSTQLYDGVAVSYNDMQPGDIISWGYVDGQPSHSSLYVGNGMMIHAANPSMGVILSEVSYWQNHSGTRILSIRRI